MASSQALTRTLRDVVLDLFLFPIWWYGKGFVLMVNWVFDTVIASARSLSLRVWIQNFFVPMYGHYDWQSRLISVFMRFMQIFFRLFALGVWFIFAIGALFLYACIPLLLVSALVYHAAGFFS